jgi:GNAT superfamily N-acetyltransferase
MASGKVVFRDAPRIANHLDARARVSGSVRRAPEPDADIRIRVPVAARDADAIAALLGQLGYPATGEEVTRRLAILGGFDHAVVLVAEVQGRIAGIVTGHLFPSVHANEPASWLTTLVVDSERRNAGIGSRLAAHIEEWAASRGAVRISVSSGLQREDAHRFYERLGYRRSGVRLTKTLPPK